MHTEEQWERGQSCFTADGAHAEFVAKVYDDGYLIYRLHDASSWDGEPCEVEGGLDIVREIYRKPPVQRFASEIDALKAEVAQLEERRAAVRAKTEEAEREHLERMKEYARFAGLKHLDNFIAGKITHFVHQNYSGLKIKTKDESLATDDKFDHRDGLKLVTLFGRSNGDLEWKLNHYSDGSGTYSTIYPCCSHEEALKIAAAILDSWWAKVREAGDKYIPDFHVAYSSATAVGLAIPDDMQARMIAIERKKAERDLAKAKDAYDAARKSLDGLAGEQSQ